MALGRRGGGGGYMCFAAFFSGYHSRGLCFTGGSFPDPASLYEGEAAAALFRGPLGPFMSYRKKTHSSSWIEMSFVPVREGRTFLVLLFADAFPSRFRLRSSSFRASGRCLNTASELAEISLGTSTKYMLPHISSVRRFWTDLGV